MSHRRALVASLAFAAIAWSGTARATSTGYVCQSGWTPNPAALASYLNNMGAYGAVYAYVYTQPKCAGTQVGMAYYCTVGATNTSYCTTSQLLTEHQAAALSLALQNAGAQSQKVTLYSTGSAGSYVEFTQP